MCLACAARPERGPLHCSMPKDCNLMYSAEDHAVRQHAPFISVIERPHHSKAVVSWRDATNCRYGDQVWNATTAREDGVCALSGKPIARGDQVYRPRRSRPAALNADCMILASALEAACDLVEPLRDENCPTMHRRSR